jgi:3-oxoacyl-[acyl-carrier protein] reductase
MDVGRSRLYLVFINGISVMFPGTILITGSNGGIGCELADYLLTLGVRDIALHYHSVSDRIKECLLKHDCDPAKHLFNGSLTSEADVQSLRHGIEQRFGEVWGLLNVAGGSTNAMSWKMSAAEFHKVIDDNLTSTFLCCREFIPGMRKREAGRIINFTSIVASTGAIGAAHYSAAKAGISGWTKSLALELASKRITANALALGYFNYGLINQLTPELQAQVKEKIPLKRFGEGREIGGFVKFLLSDEGQYTTGQTLHINGGQY